MTYSLPQLPVDVAEIVLDHLSDSPQTLKSCATTCWSLCLPSQRRLYHTVRLGYGSIDAFERLTGQYKHISAFVRELHLDFASSSCYATEPASDLAKLAESVSLLDTLCISGDYVRDDVFSRRDTLENGFQNVHTLRVNETGTRDVQEFIALLGTFPLLRDLTVKLRGVSVDVEALGYLLYGSEQHVPSNGPRPPSMARLTRFSMDIVGNAEAAVFCHLCAEFAGTLEHLELVVRMEVCAPGKRSV
jgi:hypothetical protein